MKTQWLDGTGALPTQANRRGLRRSVGLVLHPHSTCLSVCSGWWEPKQKAVSFLAWDGVLGCRNSWKLKGKFLTDRSQPQKGSNSKSVNKSLSAVFFFFSFGWILNSDCLERTPRSCKNEEPEQRFPAFVHSRRGSLDFRLDKPLRLPMQTQKGHISSGRDDVLGPRVCSIIMSSNQILPQ